MKVFFVLFISGLIGVTRLEKCNIPPTTYNLALFSKVCQSSTFDATPRPEAECAVDGISESNNTRYTCSMTDLQMEPWWSVDLGGTFVIGFIHIVNRQDSAYQYLENFEIRVGDSPDRDNPVCAIIRGVKQSKALYKFFCGMPGQHVTVILRGKPGILSLCEIKIYQHVPEEGEGN